MFISDTIAAVATGMQASGIGIIRISGPDAFAIACNIFRAGVNKRRLDKLISHHVYYGFIFDGEIMLDEILLVPFQAPKSYTAEDTVELNCHGGVLVMKRILQLLVKQGARIAEPGEFTKRAFLNGRIDLSEAESVMDVIESKNQLALDNSLKQLTGSLYEKIRELREEILNEIAFIEAALDDPEHISLEGYPEQILTRSEKILSELHRLTDSFNNGRILKEGIKTVILGRPNVGKSSLLNSLSGNEKAIVTEIPGTTRDIIEEHILLDGLSLIVYDTAGIRKATDPVEKIGVGRARDHAKQADLILFMIDSSVPLSDNDREIFSFIEGRKAIILLNKSDLPSVVSEEDISIHNKSSFPVISVSLMNGEGLKKLSGTIREMFFSGEIGFNDELMITNERHLSLLNRAVTSVEHVRSSAENGLPEDFLSIDLMDAYDLLGMIIGEKIEDDLVDMIFARFCVGK